MFQGTRLPDGAYVDVAGGYSKHVLDGQECWMVKAPTGGASFYIGHANADGSPYHWVRENDDGTITVEPMPPDAPPERRNSNSIASGSWHGYIRDGVWQEV